MKTILLGDTHGRTLWKDIVTKESPDQVVFIGDYFDSLEISQENQLRNFIDILEYKYRIPNTILLIGNHDFHYMFNYERYSGFQPKMYPTFNHLLNEEKDSFQMAFLLDDLLCTHAGVSAEWLKDNDISEDADIVKEINELFIAQPRRFMFNGIDPTGGDTYQTPIWIRPVQLMRANKNSSLKKTYRQVVGHTQVSADASIETLNKFTGGQYFLIDVIHQRKYLVYNDGELTFEKI